MDAVLSTVGTIVVECGKCLCAPVWMNIINFCKFSSNVHDLENQMGSLLDSKKRIQGQLDLEEVDGNIRNLQVVMWLQKIEEMETSVASIQRVITANKEKLHVCGTNPSLRYKLSKQVVEKLNQVKQILSEDLPPQPLVMVDLRLKAVEERPGPSITNQDTASKNLQMVMDQLKENNIRVIGVWGMGGVGKTALVTSLNNKLSNDDAKAFGLVVWVTVSKDADEKKIQHRLRERLNLERGNVETTEGIAAKIFARLKNERFLLILDDVWEPLDLDKVGIPRREDHSGYKILLTTRFRGVCDRMRADVKLHVVPLTEDEAWALFAQTAGDVVNSGGDVKTLAEAVAKECAGLPLAILVVGGAMRGETNNESWKVALRALQKSNPVPIIQGVEKEVFLPLKLSYDFLANQNFRECFLYCCLYPEDSDIPLKELLPCWRAEGYLDEWEDHEDPYPFGRMMIERLKDSCLLEAAMIHGDKSVNHVKCMTLYVILAFGWLLTQKMGAVDPWFDLVVA